MIETLCSAAFFLAELLATTIFNGGSGSFRKRKEFTGIQSYQVKLFRSFLRNSQFCILQKDPVPRSITGSTDELHIQQPHVRLDQLRVRDHRGRHLGGAHDTGTVSANRNGEHDVYARGGHRQRHRQTVPDRFRGLGVEGGVAPTSCVSYTTNQSFSNKV